MEILQKDMWDFIDEVDAICVTSNGFVKKNGRAVMGRGCALDAKERFKDIDLSLGQHIKEHGNVPGVIHKVGKTSIVSFPVKKKSDIYDHRQEHMLVKHMKGKFKLGQVVPGWAMKAELRIIENSAKLLRSMIDRYKWESVVMTQPGCMNGELDWNEVQPIIERYLSNKVIIVRK